MRTVYSSASEVIHLFAQRTQDNAKCSNVFFNTPNKIYSYGHHYLLGEFVENKKGEVAIIIDDSGYSQTTSKHISLMRVATRQYMQFNRTQIDLNKVFNAITENVRLLQTARKKEKYIDPSIYLFEKLNEYIKWSNKAEIKKFDLYKKIVELMKVINGGDFEKYLADAKKRRLAELKKTEKLRLERLKIQIEKFHNYEGNYITETEEDFLRLSKNGELVETSQGVKVSIKEAKILYSMIVAKKDIVGFKISDYTVISINGTLKIGCHKINMESVHKVGQLLIENSEE
ncbi:MAG TPA: hypothetical protein VIV55_10285 [Flavobacterium sp.]